MFYIDIEELQIRPHGGESGPMDRAFASEKALLAIAGEQNWSKEQVTAIWNRLAELRGLKRQMMFKNRPYGISAIWKAIQRLAKREDTTPQPKPERARKAAKRPKAAAKKAKPDKRESAAAAEPREGSKKAAVIAMLQRKQGVSGPELMEAFGWLAHTCRGLLSTLRSKGFAMTAEKDEKRGMVYKAA